MVFQRLTTYRKSGRLLILREMEILRQRSPKIRGKKCQWYDLLDYMAGKHQPEELLQDVDARQRNVVFPDTLNNETRFWRNIGNQPWTPLSTIGLAILALGFGGFLVSAVVAAIHASAGLKLALGMLLIWGPIFGAIAWATRRALRNSSHRSNHRK